MAMKRSRCALALRGIALAMALSACGDGGAGPDREPASLAVVFGSQTAPVNTAVAHPPGVRVLNADGDPVPGVTVAFTVTLGNGTVEGGTPVTDETGSAVVARWTLGTTAGANRLTARVGELTADIAATGTHGPPAALVLVTQPPAIVFTGMVFAPQPVAELRDAWGNVATDASGTVTASLAAGSGTLNGLTTVAVGAGRATFTNLAVSGEGTHQLAFTTALLEPTLSASFNVATTVDGSCPGTGGLVLDLELGETVRRTTAADDAITCLSFHPTNAAGHQYLVLLENLPVTGLYESGLFPGAVTDADLTATLTVLPATFAAADLLTLRHAVAKADPAVHAWEFPGGVLHEAQVQPPAGAAPEPRVLRDGELIALNSLLADPQVGDTLIVRLEGIPRLSIPTGDQRAVIRYISSDLIFAEDVRLQTVLVRDGGGYNTPMTVADMEAIASEYAAYAKPQGDALFDGRHNAQTEGGARGAGRVLAVHTLMPSNGTWGYTYSVTDYFAFDYWVATNGMNKGFNQIPQRVADDLFMHEIAHLRQCGLLERAGKTCFERGHRWLVEGFARFAERLPIAMRLLAQATPPRTGNVILPMNPVFDGSYYYDDVPTYLNGGSNMLGGYAASSYVFDYFADRVAASGQDPMPALRDLLANGGTEAGLSAAIERWLPGTSFGELFTRSRIALYADDYGTIGLPLETQYQQFQLRASRPPGSRSDEDPRNVWPKLYPGVLAQEAVTVQPGAAYGYLIDGTAATGGARIDVNAAPSPNAVLSISRVR